MEEQRYIVRMHPIADMKDKDMANGMRDMSRTPLDDDEIEYVKSEIKRIEADEAVFVFNDEMHIAKSTCYNVSDDKIYVTRKYASIHPRDIMSVGAVLAHEYYGHRTYREEYLEDEKNQKLTTPYWQDECRASITAAKLAPNLTDKDKRDLIQDAVYRAQEAGQLIELDEFMKEVVYGYSKGERNISREIEPIRYIDQASVLGAFHDRGDERNMSEMWGDSDDYLDLER